MISNSVFRPLLLCGAMAIQVFGGVSCASSSQSEGDDNNTTSANVASMTIELSDSLLRVGPTSDTIDLGRMYAGEVIRRDLAIRNVGPSAFLILEVKTSCGCTQVDFYKKPIRSGESVPFSFEFDSRGFNGYQLKHITLRTSLGAQPYTLVVTGEVIPES